MNIEKYTQNAQGAIIDCQNIAVEEGHQQIDGEHLHLALLMQKDGLIPKLLKFMDSEHGRESSELWYSSRSINCLRYPAVLRIHVHRQGGCSSSF